MAAKVKKSGPAPAEIPQMPFDDALRALLGASPQHKKAKKTIKQKDKRQEKKK